METSTVVKSTPEKVWVYCVEFYGQGPCLSVYRDVDALRQGLLNDLRDYDDYVQEVEEDGEELLANADPQRIVDALAELSDAYRYIVEVPLLPAE